VQIWRKDLIVSGWDFFVVLGQDVCAVCGSGSEFGDLE